MPSNLFLLDRTVQSKDALLAGLNTNTTYVEFEPLVDTYASLKEKVVAKIAENGSPFTHIALAQHSTMDTMYSIVRTSAPLNLEDVAPYASWNELKGFLGELKALGTITFDFLACSIYKHVNMQSIFAHLESESGLNLRASSNFTGNFEQGGDWILESDNVDVRNLYFNDSIEQYSELLYLILNNGLSTNVAKFVSPTSGSEYIPFLRRVGGTGSTGGQYYTAIENSLYQEIPAGKTVISAIQSISINIVGYTVLFSDNTMMTVKQVGTYVKTVTYDSIPAGKTVTGLCSNDSGTYCAILNDGSIYMWGEFSAPVLPDNIKIVKSFGQPNTTNFLLLTNNRRLYRINGNTDHGYGSIEGYEVEKLCYVDTLPSIIYTNGTTNFNGIPAGLIPAGLGIKDIVRCGSSEYIYIALLTNNTVVTWKNYTTSPSITNLNTALLAGKTVTGIYADSYVAVVACSDNTIVSCGRKVNGGASNPIVPQGVTIRKITGSVLGNGLQISLSNNTIIRSTSSGWQTVPGKDIYDGMILPIDNSIYYTGDTVYNAVSNPNPLVVPSGKYLKYTNAISVFYYTGYLFNSNIHAPVTGITPITSPKSTIRFLGEQVQLSCSVIPANAEDSLIRWYSSNETFATVSETGLVTALNNGNVTIIAISRDGDYMATYDIIVNNVPVTGISAITAALPSQLNLHTLALVNATLQLTATVNPLNASNPNITWTSSNPSIATVSSSGLVTALARGTTYITATSVEGNYVSYPYSINVDVPTTTGVTNNVTVNTTAVTATDANTIRNAISSTTLSAANSIAQIRTELTQGGVADTQIAKSATVTSGVNTFQAAVADVTAINTMYNSGTSVKLASTTNSAVDTFIPSTPNVASVGVVLTETKVSTTNPTVAAVTIAVAKLDANNNRIVSTLTDPTTFDTVVVTLPKTAYLKITHLGGSYEATNQVYTDVSNTTIGAIDLTNVYPGKLYTFTSAVVPYVNNIKILVLDHTVTTVKVAYTGPFSETVFEPATAPPPDALISTETANPSSIACFPTGTRLLTPSGYKAVETLKTGDKITTADGRIVTGKVYCTTIAKATELTAPYRIRANTFSNQSSDLCVSPLHAIQKAKGIWEIPEMAAKRYATIEQYGVGETVTYYHVEAPNFYTDNLVAEGVTVESYAGKQVSLPKGTPLYKFNAKINGFTRYTPSKSVKKN